MNPERATMQICLLQLYIYNIHITISVQMMKQKEDVMKTYSLMKETQRRELESCLLLF